MTYTPISRQLISHEDAISLEMEKALTLALAKKAFTERQLNKLANFGSTYGLSGVAFAKALLHVRTRLQQQPAPRGWLTRRLK